MLSLSPSLLPSLPPLSLSPSLSRSWLNISKIGFWLPWIELWNNIQELRWEEVNSSWSSATPQLQGPLGEVHVLGPSKAHQNVSCRQEVRSVANVSMFRLGFLQETLRDPGRAGGNSKKMKTLGSKLAGLRTPFLQPAPFPFSLDRPTWTFTNLNC